MGPTVKWKQKDRRVIILGNGLLLPVEHVEPLGKETHAAHHPLLNRLMAEEFEDGFEGCLNPAHAARACGCA